MMKFLFVLAWLNGGEVSLYIEPVETMQDCSARMMEFHLEHEDAIFEASCIDIIKSLGAEERQAFNG